MDWWDDETVKQYTERAHCFVSQYGNYTPEEAGNMTVLFMESCRSYDFLNSSLRIFFVSFQLNGNNTLGENIADNGGIRQAFRAYQSFVEKNGPEARLPGLEYSPEQLFFVAFSQVFTISEWYTIPSYLICQ